MLSLSGKPYLRLFEDFTGVDKKIVTLERDDAMRDSLYYQREYEGANARMETLQKERDEIQLKLIDAENKIYKLEALFLNRGVSKEQLEQMIA